MFVSLEGIDGSGKTTQAKLLAKALGEDVVLVREPGGTKAGERIRGVLKDPSRGARSTRRAAALLRGPGGAGRRGASSRRARQGRDVVCDRFSDSSVAYQGVARGLGIERVEEICDLATGGVWPDLTILLRIDPDQGGQANRPAQGRPLRGGGDRAAAAGRRADTTRWPRRHPDRIRAIDADAEHDAVHAKVLAEVQAVMA